LILFYSTVIGVGSSRQDLSNKVHWIKIKRYWINLNWSARVCFSLLHVFIILFNTASSLVFNYMKIKCSFQCFSKPPSQCFIWINMAVMLSIPKSDSALFDTYSSRRFYKIFPRSFELPSIFLCIHLVIC